MENLTIEKLDWLGPKDYRIGSAVYAVLLMTNDDYQIVKIGASRNLYGRLGTYKKAFKLDPRLKYAYHCLTDEFKAFMQELIGKHFPKYEKDQKRLELVIESLLIRKYIERHGQRPPANTDKGPNRHYFKKISINEDGVLKILDKKPASRDLLDKKVLYILTKRKKFKQLE